MLSRLCMIGAVVEVTKCDAAFIAANFDDWIERVYPYCVELLEDRRRRMKEH